MQTPILTLAIPTYRRENWLRRLLDSLSTQTAVTNGLVEVIVSDNCSPDRTQLVLSEFEQKIPGMRTFRQPSNIGVDANYLFLIKNSKGAYLWIVPDDDLPLAGVGVARVLEHIASCQHPPSFLLLNANVTDLESGAILKTADSGMGNVWLEDGKDILSLADDTDLLSTVRLVFRRESLEHPFLLTYPARSLMTPLVMSLLACSSGGALVVREVVAEYGAGAAEQGTASSGAHQHEWSGWRRLYVIDMPFLLKRAVRELGYSKEAVDRILLRRSRSVLPLLLFHNRGSVRFLVDVQQGLLRKYIYLYGWKIMSFQLLACVPIILIEAAMRLPRELSRPRALIRKITSLRTQAKCRG